MVWEDLLDQSLPTEAEQIKAFTQKVDCALSHANQNFCTVAYPASTGEIPGVPCNVHIERSSDVTILREEMVGNNFRGEVDQRFYPLLFNPNERGYPYANLIFVNSIKNCESETIVSAEDDDDVFYNGCTNRPKGGMLIASNGLDPKMNIIAHEIAHLLIPPDTQKETDAGTSARADGGLIEADGHLQCGRTIILDGKAYSTTFKTLLTVCPNVPSDRGFLENSLVPAPICNRMLQSKVSQHFGEAGGHHLLTVQGSERVCLKQEPTCN